MRLRMRLKDVKTDMAITTLFGQEVHSVVPCSVELTFVTDGPQHAGLDEIRDWLGKHYAARVDVDLFDVHKQPDGATNDTFTARVRDSGGGFVDLVVDRDTARYPMPGSRVRVEVL